MTEQFLGEIRLIGFGYAPDGWALCNGQILLINVNQALFTLLGATYGGDGMRTFALPNLQVSVPVGAGSGPNLPPISLGQVNGEATHTLTLNEIPTHMHQVFASDTTADAPSPAAAVWANSATNPFNATANGTMAPGAIAPWGGSQPHSNLQPYLKLNYCIALTGIFPSRN